MLRVKSHSACTISALSLALGLALIWRHRRTQARSTVFLIILVLGSAAVCAECFARDTYLDALLLRLNGVQLQYLLFSTIPSRRQPLPPPAAPPAPPAPLAVTVHAG